MGGKDPNVTGASGRISRLGNDEIVVPRKTGVYSRFHVKLDLYRFKKNLGT